ncbi:Ger(x)C family spore germination protein [Fictibacillus enclensis]|uniref:Ger(x)C family spore germination protein n=1 Tax=Fictibacillus enclensis TaxID=1017270 RepID=UPI0025A0C401|nr:Ger(x)C family spore germination protein [Fictibacillus enclensis]MDM5198436.1 Ger(x)C family spore germination protein [Fictibacillus enclensis]
MKTFPFIVLLIFSLILSGCTEPKILERVGLITAVGYDDAKDGNGKIKGTAAILQVDPDALQNVDIMTDEGYTSKGIVNLENLRSSRKIRSGQLRVALFSDRLAKKGLINFADSLTRDPSISEIVYMCIAEPTSADILNHQYENIPDIGEYLFRLLDQNIKNEEIPSPTIHEFMKGHYAAGFDPVAPILKRKGESVKINGIALMKNDRMVGKLNTKEGYYIKLINGRYNGGNMEFLLPKGSLDPILPKKEKRGIPVAIDTLQSSSKINVINAKEKRFNVSLKIRARLLEIRVPVNLDDPKNMVFVQKVIQNKIKKQADNVIKYALSKEADPFGFGETYRSSVRNSNLTRDQWHKEVPGIKVNVDVDFQLLRTGVID